MPDECEALLSDGQLVGEEIALLGQGWNSPSHTVHLAILQTKAFIFTELNTLPLIKMFFIDMFYIYFQK